MNSTHVWCKHQDSNPHATLEGGGGGGVSDLNTVPPLYHYTINFSLLHNSMYYEFWKANYMCFFWEMEM